jgi:hypothetical protein
MRVLVVFVRHGTDKYRNALDDLNRIYQMRAPGLARQTIVVDNAIPVGVSEEYGPDRTLIGGDNTSWEFSGWQRALDELGSEVKCFDAVHFVSSAFQMLYTDYLDRFSPQIVEVVAQRAVCTGHIDYYPHPIRFGAYISRHWIRTSFWLINTFELMRLGKLVSIKDRRGLFSRDGDWPFDINGPISLGYQGLMYDWLTSEQGTGQGAPWHSRLDLNVEDDRKLFEAKAIAIMNEHLLSIRLRAQGTYVVDMTCLAELTEAGNTLPAHCLGWREQMKLRRIPGHDNIGDTAAR